VRRRLNAWSDQGSHGGGGDGFRNTPAREKLVEISMGGMVWSAG
jgi:hypothetical protein